VQILVLKAWHKDFITVLGVGPSDYKETLNPTTYTKLSVLKFILHQNLYTEWCSTLWQVSSRLFWALPYYYINIKILKMFWCSSW